MPEVAFEARRIICTWEWLEHELHKPLNRFDIDLSTRETYSIPIEPVGAGGVVSKVGVQLIFGKNPEPFLASALRSVAWADYVCAVNTAPEDGPAQENEMTVRRTCQALAMSLRLEHLRMGTMDFAKARNKALSLADPGDWVLIVDADDVHWPEFEDVVREAVSGFRLHDALGTPNATAGPVYAAHFWHHCVYKDLWHSLPHRKILFPNSPGVQFVNTMGNVHEELVGLPEAYELVPDYRYHHYGYIKSAREVARRWEDYRKLGAAIHDYDVSQPDRALDDWPRVCKIFTGEHPPAVREVLEGYPSSPSRVYEGRDLRVSDHPRVGLVMLTWDDEENLRRCLATLERTTEPFKLWVVDNGSRDGGPEHIRRWFERNADRWGGYWGKSSGEGRSLTEALNIGFWLAQGDESTLDYIGWIHPDHSFEWPFWLTELRQAMDDHPEYAKLGATEAGYPAELRAGNSQCYLVRRTALEQVGLFDEKFIACGGWEDWDHNRRLLEVGKVMIWPDAVVRHEAMSTRARHDNVEAAKRNGGYYTEKWGDSEPPV